MGSQDPILFFKIKFYLRFLIEVYTPRTPANDAVASVNTSVSIPAFGSFFLSVVVFTGLLTLLSEEVLSTFSDFLTKVTFFFSAFFLNSSAFFFFI